MTEKKAQEAVAIYLAGGLFNAGEQVHNLFLEKHLLLLGYRTILPQREARKFIRDDGSFDLKAVVLECARHAVDGKNICVVSADGADADSGTCVEFGMAITATGSAVVYRTDFRQTGECEFGVSAMLTVPNSVIISHPCFLTNLDEVETYYQELSSKIHEAIQKALTLRVKAFGSSG